MGNHTTKSDSHHHHHQRKNDLVDAFFEWSLAQNKEKLNINFVKNYFEHCKIISIIFENEFSEDICRDFLIDLVEAHSSIGVAQVFLSYLYRERQLLDYKAINDIIEECLITTLNVTYETTTISAKDLSHYAKDSLQSIAKSVKQNSSKETDFQVAQNELQDWIYQEFPELFYSYNSWLCKRLREKKFIEKDAAQPSVKCKDLSDFMNVTTAWFLCSTLPLPYLKALNYEGVSLAEKLKNCLVDTKWNKLYSSESHGLSLNRFSSHLFNYKGPTITFICCKSETCYIVCSDFEYKEAPTPYGSELTKIYQIWPVLKDFELNTPSKAIYLNTKSRGLRLGMIFGDNDKKPIFQIDEDFHKVTHALNQVDVLTSIETWGCGLPNELARQKDIQNWEKKQLEKMRTTGKLKTSWDENPDKAILDLAGISVENSQRGDF